jgi:hypothetical protein
MTGVSRKHLYAITLAANASADAAEALAADPSDRERKNRVWPLASAQRRAKSARPQ